MDAPSEQLRRHLGHVLRDLVAPDEPAPAYELVDVLDRVRSCTLLLDGATVAEAPTWAGVVESLLWEVNRRAVAGTDGHLLLHAAAAAAGDGGPAVVVAGESGAGKTTLVAALLEAGLAYVTDEAVAVELVSGVVRAYPRPLSLRPGAWTLLPGYEPVSPPAAGPYEPDRWYVPAPGRVAWHSRPALLLFPEVRTGERTRLEPLARPEALLQLAGMAFDLDRHGRAGFACLARVVRSSRCARLVIGDLNAARDVVARELAAA